jgi:hypothetical protein
MRCLEPVHTDAAGGEFMLAMPSSLRQISATTGVAIVQFERMTTGGNLADEQLHRREA